MAVPRCDLLAGLRQLVEREMAGGIEQAVARAILPVAHHQRAPDEFGDAWSRPPRPRRRWRRRSRSCRERRRAHAACADHPAPADRSSRPATRRASGGAAAPGPSRPRGSPVAASSWRSTVSMPNRRGARRSHLDAPAPRRRAAGRAGRRSAVRRRTASRRTSRSNRRETGPMRCRPCALARVNGEGQQLEHMLLGEAEGHLRWW